MLKYFALFAALCAVISAKPQFKQYGKRCASLFDESCINPNPGQGNNEEWLGGTGAGKRQLEYVQQQSPGFFKNLADFFDRVHMVATKRCAGLFDETCINPGAGGSDNGWIENNPAGRKRCANLFDESCIFPSPYPPPGGSGEHIPGAGRR